MSLEGTLASSASLSAVREALPDRETGSWFVGGAVRDLLLGTEVDDVDIATASDPRELARVLHRALGGDVFSLSDRFGTWRIHTSDGFQVDVTALRGGDIAEDLAHRDFAANAMAVSTTDGRLVDPFGGAADVERRLLRLVSEDAYTDDPLRPLRLPRLAAALGFEIDQQTAAATRRHAAGITASAPERVFAELRALVGCDEALRGMRLLDELELTPSVLAEFAALEGVEQSVYHHRDVKGHSLEVLEHAIAMERAGWDLFGDSAARLAEVMRCDLADGLTVAEGLRWAALLHDIAKPQTRIVRDDGSIGFPAHDREGAEIVRSICRRMNTSVRFAQFVAAITRHHLLLGFMVDRGPLSRRELHRYLVASAPVAVEVSVFSVADRMATRGRKSEAAIAAHVELAREVIPAALDHRLNPPRPLVRGDQLVGALAVEAGPKIGELLALIAEAQFAGEVATSEDAIALARSAL